MIQDFRDPGLGLLKIGDANYKGSQSERGKLGKAADVLDLDISGEQRPPLLIISPDANLISTEVFGMIPKADLAYCGT